MAPLLIIIRDNLENETQYAMASEQFASKSHPTAPPPTVQREAVVRKALRLTLIRDLPTRYIRDQAQAKTGNAWNVLGEFDYALFQQIDDLPDLAKHDIEAPKTPEERCSTVLIPLDWNSTDTGFANGLIKPQESDFLIVASFTLSPALYSMRIAPQNAAHLCTNVAKLISKKLSAGNGEVQNETGGAQIDSIKYEIYNGLGGADIILVCTFSHPLAFRKIASLLDRVSAMFAQTAMGEIQKEFNIGLVSQAKGHLFASSQKWIGFGGKAESTAGSKDFINAEIDGLSFDIHVRPDVGHAKQVRGCLEKKFKEIHSDYENSNHIEAKVENEFGWSQLPIVAHTKHLIDVIRIFNECFLDSQWRCLHVARTLTTPITIGVDETNPNNQDQRYWQLDQKIKGEIDHLTDLIKTTVEKFSQIQHLMDLQSWFAVYKNCFYRQDLVLAADELRPFVSSYVEAVAQFYSILDDPATLIPNQVVIAARQSMIQYLAVLHDVLANRIEHAGDATFPTLPKTLENGTCKLVSAYAGMAKWACDQFKLSGNSSAAIIYEGSQGYVTTEEPLRDFRRFVEDNGMAPLLSERKSGWRSRLFGIDISGSISLEPEIAFCCILHEAAEQSEWLWDSKLSELRHLLNSHFELEISTRVAAAVKTQTRVSGRNLTHYIDLFLHHFTRDLARRRPEGHGAQRWSAILENVVADKTGLLCANRLHPKLYGELVKNALRALNDDHVRVGGLSANELWERSGLLINEKPLVCSALKDYSFAVSLVDLEKLTGEISADFGMLLHIKSILSLDYRQNGTRDECIVLKSLIERLYIRMIRTRKSVFPERSHNMSASLDVKPTSDLAMLIARWIVAAQIATDRMPDEKIEDFNARIVSDIKTKLDLAGDPDLTSDVDAAVKLLTQKFFTMLISKLRNQYAAKKPVCGIGVEDALNHTVACLIDPSLKARYEMIMGWWGWSLSRPLKPLE